METGKNTIYLFNDVISALHSYTASYFVHDNNNNNSNGNGQSVLTTGRANCLLSNRSDRIMSSPQCTVTFDLFVTSTSTCAIVVLMTSHAREYPHILDF